MKNQARHFGRLRRAEMCTAYIFILPMFAGLLLFSIIPFIQNILYSFRKMGTFGEGTFIGLKNYQDLLKDDTNEDEQKFHPAFPVSKLRVCLTWEKAKQKGLFDQNTEA